MLEGRKKRRTNDQIKNDLLNAVGKALVEHGFANLGVNLIAEYAQVNKNTLYKHYNSFQDLLTQYIENQDYWLKVLYSLRDYKVTDFRGFMKELILRQHLAIYQSKEIKQLLIWELGELSDRTKAIAQERDDFSKEILQQYTEFFKDSEIDINIISAILIAGVYYLVLHKEHSTFCQVDINKEKDRISKGIEQLTDMIFDTLKQRNREIDITRKMKAKGIDINVISEVTGFAIDEIKEF